MGRLVSVGAPVYCVVKSSALLVANILMLLLQLTGARTVLSEEPGLKVAPELTDRALAVMLAPMVVVPPEIVRLGKVVKLADKLFVPVKVKVLVVDAELSNPKALKETSLKLAQVRFALVLRFKVPVLP